VPIHSLLKTKNKRSFSCCCKLTKPRHCYKSFFPQEDVKIVLFHWQREEEGFDSFSAEVCSTFVYKRCALFNPMQCFQLVTDKAFLMPGQFPQKQFTNFL
jgi:hypothetical protein